MSTIIKFFLAAGHEAAAAVVDQGPSGDYEVLECGNFDADEALIEWEGILTGRSFDELVDADEPETVAGDGEGPVVLAASQALQDALATADQFRLGEAGRLWVHERAADGEMFDQQLATELMHELARLVRGIDARDRRRLYCWTA
ncbi:hypothetical protein ACFQ07_27925 [Actinomadura adrarensis]|uniref:DUF1877 family protein n=1 Tax=Actinomadura adrarensis TaxID=1819600 RepID=A0ABW3CRB0_9ACTN